ncbi:MAG: response regulator [Myxococcaceae bacterium]|nr:MAG: response regulator [Myxococcaceae bacterium]
MGKPLRVLLVEDSEDDALLLIRELRRGGYSVEWERVDTEADLRIALARAPWDIVFSDFHMPAFSAQGAFAVVQAHVLDVPFIIISGTVGEETAVAAMREGVNDYLIKGSLARLVPAVERELKKVADRREQRALEDRLRETRAQLEQIVAAIPDVFWSARVVDRRPIMVFVTPSCRGVLGEEAETLLERPNLWIDMIDEVDQPEVRVALSRAIDAATPATIAYRVRVNGEVRWIENAVVPIVEGSRVTALRGVARDVSARRALEEQLMFADRMVSMGTLAAGVAHEINNPLAVVLAGIEFASEALDGTGHGGALSHSEAREALSDASEGAERVRTIVRDLKLFSRVDDERSEAVDVRAVFESSIRMAWNEIRHRARLVRVYSDVPLVEANNARLGQVFLNLLINAVHAIDEGRVNDNEICVTISLDPRGRVAVEVSDTGCGIPPDVAGRIFEPFFSTKPIGVGTGLGLSICRRILERFNGTIDVRSEPGRGATFRVLLPRAVEREVSAPPVSVLPEQAALRAKVLVVDDEPSIGIMMCRTLADLCDVRSTTRAAEALAWIAEGADFDVVFCDLMMPDFTGMDLHAELQRVAPSMTDRMIFMTGEAFTRRARTFLDSVPNARLEKPFDLRTLRALVERRGQEGVADAAHTPA